MGLQSSHAVVVPGGDNIVVWALDRNIDVDYSVPTMTHVMNGDNNFSGNLNLQDVVQEGSYNYWLIQQAPGLPPIPHPIHLHGHDFFVLGQGNTTYSNISELNFQTPARRDTATIYGNGWLAIAFKSNNPGAWLMHRHLAWHVAEGSGVQFLEAPERMVLPKKTAYDTQCAVWDKYYAVSYYKKLDSGV